MTAKDWSYMVFFVGLVIWALVIIVFILNPSIAEQFKSDGPSCRLMADEMVCEE